MQTLFKRRRFLLQASNAEDKGKDGNREPRKKSYTSALNTRIMKFDLAGDSWTGTIHEGGKMENSRRDKPENLLT